VRACTAKALVGSFEAMAKQALAPQRQSEPLIAYTCRYASLHGNL